MRGASDAGETAAAELQRIAASIGDLEGRIGRGQEETARRGAQLAAVHAAWHPQVQAMAARINDNFGRFFGQLNCLGEVRLEEHGQEYDQWEMSILVRFRDDEQLQRLTAHRQSGGEKSVSTILYLLALQELSKSPFRVVDEINQGMDALNERRVHSLIVQTATASQHRSQYFLITPKLLTELEYDEHMHVLCVYNGEGMPPPQAWREQPRPLPQGAAVGAD